MSLLVFILLVLLLLPVSAVGGIVFSVEIMLKTLRRGFSVTAYDPMFARWFMHHTGARTDDAAAAMITGLPGVSEWPLRLAIGPTLWATQVSGYKPHIYDYAAQTSTSLFDGLGQRTRFFDEALTGYLDSVTQVVVLGAGWDTRAYGMAKRPGVRVFEVDTPATQSRKRAALEQSGIDSSHVTFVAVDFNTESWLKALLHEGFDLAQPTFVLWEGVSYYLNAAAVHATLQTVGDELAPGSAIAFDYPSQGIVEGSNSTLAYRSALPVLRLYGEPWTFGIPTTPHAREALAGFLAPHGLHLSAFEPYGIEKDGQHAHGGLALATNA